MSSTCDYCRGPLAGDGLRGRPWPGRDAGRYCCYGCLSLGEEREPSASRDPHLGSLAWRLGLGVLLAGQSMLLGLGVNLAPPDEPETLLLLQGLVLACTLVVIVALGFPLFANAFAETRSGRVTVEALFLLTLVGAFVASLQSLMAGVGPIYFETVSVLLVVYTVGKLIGARSRARALDRSSPWSAELARCRLLDEQGQIHEVDVASVVPGDLVEVRPGEMIAVDGVVDRGVGFVCEAARTGEPFAVVRRPGDRVLAGCLVEDAVLLIRATSAGTERQVDRLIDAVENARASPSTLQGQADRLARVFLPVLLTAALLTFAYWTWADDWQIGLFNAMSVLLVACPCALGLATPIVLWNALGRLAARGLISRQGDLIERLAAIDRVVLDKTGTLTREQFVLLDLVVSPEADRALVVRLLAAVESRSSHPVARAFLDLVPAEVLAQVRILTLTVVPGCGIEARVDADGTEHSLRVGRPDWPMAPSPALLAQLRVSVGHRVDVELDGRTIAVAMLGEQLRESASEAMHDFERLGLRVEVLTGDTTERAQAALEHVSVRGQVSPEEKQQLVQEMMVDGVQPLFVGDGINDAAALATATAGVALASGTDLAVGSATATLYGGDLRVLAWAVSLSREAMRIARSTILWAATYNLVGMALAALGLLHPVAAALLMAGSSFWVAWLSSRVGTVNVTCHPRAPSVPASIGPKTAIHALALTAQAPLLVTLLDLSSAFPVALVVLLLAALLALIWQSWEALPHGLDMLFGMMTLGNLGMLAGWWLDLGLGPVDVDCPCGCGDLLHDGLLWSSFSSHAGMWLGMLFAGSAAMLGLGRTPCPLSRWTGLRVLIGNVGMIGGMLAGSAVAGRLEGISELSPAVVHLAGMSLGMMLGMGLVHALAQAITSLTTLPNTSVSR